MPASIRTYMPTSWRKRQNSSINPITFSINLAEHRSKSLDPLHVVCGLGLDDAYVWGGLIKLRM